MSARDDARTSFLIACALSIVFIFTPPLKTDLDHPRFAQICDSLFTWIVGAGWLATYQTWRNTPK